MFRNLFDLRSEKSILQRMERRDWWRMLLLIVLLLAGTFVFGNSLFASPVKAYEESPLGICLIRDDDVDTVFSVLKPFQTCVQMLGSLYPYISKNENGFVYGYHARFDGTRATIAINAENKVWCKDCGLTVTEDNGWGVFSSDWKKLSEVLRAW